VGVGRKLFRIKCGNSLGAVSDTCSQISVIISELAIMGEPITDKVAIGVMIEAVHPRFETEITMFLAKETLTLTDCISTLLEAERSYA
jgi:hypothetical protein